MSAIFGSGLGNSGPNTVLRSHGSNRTKAKPDSLIRMLSYLKPYWGRMLIAFVCMLITTGFSLAVPFLIKTAIDGPISSGDISSLIRISSLLLIVFLGIYVFSALQKFILSWVGQRILATLRNELFKHLQELSISYHETHIIGITISRVIGDVAVINEALSLGLISIIADSLLLIGIIIAMLTLSFKLTLVTVAVLPLMIIVTFVFSKHARRAFIFAREKVARMVGNLAEAISGIAVIQAFGQGKIALKKFRILNKENQDAHVAAVSLTFKFMPAVELIGMLATAGILFFGSISVSNGVITLGVLVAFLSLVGQFFQPIQELSQLFATFQSAMAGGENVMRLLDTVPDVRNIPSLANEDDKQKALENGKIEFENVTFEYTEGVPVLSKVNLTMNAGDTIALVGQTGAGKTTIASLIARFYDVNTGNVKIDGFDVRELSQYELRRNIAIVPQEPFLFIGTIRDNIAFGIPECSDSKIFSVAKTVGLDILVEQLPHGYETFVVEGGKNLSVGQRQLISVARALICEPKIIIMDEATSSIDSITESMIQDALDKLLIGRTAIIIAHRLSTIRLADQIFLIENGRVAEQGTHSELMVAGGKYAALTRKQIESLQYKK